eukprot:scaffold57506_cov62-Phaeocystis_antarctica.AAC.11
MWIASAASRMPDSKRFRKYSELEASATRCTLNSTPSAQTAKSVSRSSRQRAVTEAWCGTPPRSVSLVAAVASCEKDVALVMVSRTHLKLLGEIGSQHNATLRSSPREAGLLRGGHAAEAEDAHEEDAVDGGEAGGNVLPDHGEA